MSTPRDPFVFISYARKDGASLARRLQQDLSTQGLEAWLDTDRISGGATWTEAIERAIDRSQVVLALLTQGSYVSDICRAEQLRSLRKGKRVIPLRAQADADIPLHLETKNYRDFAASNSYEAQFPLLLVDIRAGNNGVSLSEKFRTTYVTAPPLPRNYIERPDALLVVRRQLLKDDAGPSIAITAIQGMGGIGKTILAQALSHDEVTQQAFPDGIVWSVAGKESPYDLQTRMSEVRRALGDEPAGNESEPESINRYRSLMRDKAALIIVDDVWRVSDIEPFLVESPRSRLLLTTRDASIAASVGAEEHTLSLLTIGQSRALLARWAGIQVTDFPTNADELIDECAGLPLAISMVGAMLRGKPAGMWTQVHKLLHNADLEKIKAQFPNYPYTDLLRVIQISVGNLDDIERQRYLSLAVALEDMPIAPAVQQTLWNVDELEALSTAERFVSLSLAQRAGSLEESIRLHDLQLDYCWAQYPHRDALALIHGAVRLSSNVVSRNPTQFASQMLGRLLPYQAVPAIDKFMTELVEGAPKPWLRPLKPALYPPGTGLDRTLEGNSVVAVSANGQHAVSGGTSLTLKVWDLHTGRELHTLKGHSRPISGVAVSGDGRCAVSSSDDKTVKVWDLETGLERCTLNGHSGYVRAVSMSADGQRAISASSDRTLKVWDLETKHELRMLSGHSDAVVAVALSADGHCAISASRDQTLKVWDLETGRELRTLQGHLDAVRSVAITGDGRRAVSGSSDRTVKVWDLETGRELRTLEGHSDTVTGVVVSGDGRRAISASRDKTLKIWNVETGREIRTLQSHLESLLSVTADAAMRFVMCASPSSVTVWDLGTESAIPVLERHSDWVIGVAASADGRRAMSASEDKILKVWDPESGRVLRTLQDDSDRISRVAMTADGRRAVTASWDKTVVWDLEMGRRLHVLPGASYVALYADGRNCVCGYWDGLKIWDIETGRELRTLKDASVECVAISADGKRAISCSRDKTLKVWDLEAGLEVRTLETNTAETVAMSWDGRYAVSHSPDKTLKVWDLMTGRELRTLEGHSDWPQFVAMSADGRRALSGSHHVLTVWDIENGLPLAAFTCDDSVYSFAFIGNDKLIVGDTGGSVHFLSLSL